MKQEDVVLLLTACVRPSNMILTELQDPEERLRQYLSAVGYYMANTKCKIVLCNNSGDDFAGRFDYGDRFEYLFFDGNGYDRSLGKGYGEFEIVKYAVAHSRLIAEAKQVVKITGRLVFPDAFRSINLTLRLLRLPSDTVITRFCYYAPFAHSEFVFAPKGFFERFVAEENVINDTAGYYFEHLLHDGIVRSGFQYVSFVKPIKKIGVSGTANLQYSNDFHSRMYQLIDIYMFYQKRSEELKGTDARLSKAMRRISVGTHTWLRVYKFFRKRFAKQP